MTVKKNDSEKRQIIGSFRFLKYDIPVEWNDSNIKTVLSKNKSGISRLLSNEDIGYPVLRSENIHNDDFDPENIKYWYTTDTKGVDLTTYILEEGDIILNFINSMAQIGKTCMFRKQEREWIYTTNCFRIKTKSKKMLQEYFYHLLNSHFMKRGIRAITQPAVNQASFSKTAFEKLIIFYPDTTEQEKIVDVLSNLKKIVNFYHDPNLLDVFNAIREDLVTGKVRIK